MQTAKMKTLRAKYKAKRKVIDKLLREKKKLSDRLDVVQSKITQLGYEAGELEEAYMVEQARADVPLSKRKGI